MRHCEDGTFLLNRSSLHGFSVSSLLTLGFQLPFIITVLQIQDESEELSASLGSHVTIAQSCTRASQELSRDLNPCWVRGSHLPRSTAEQNRTASTAQLRLPDQLCSHMGFKFWHHLHLHNLWGRHRVAQVEMRAACALQEHFMHEPKNPSFQKVNSSAKPGLLQKAF